MHSGRLLIIALSFIISIYILKFFIVFTKQLITKALPLFILTAAAAQNKKTAVITVSLRA